MPPVSPTRTIRSVTQPGVAAQLCLALAALAYVFGAWTTWVRRSEVADMRAGRNRLTAVRADELDDLVLTGLVVEIAATLICAAFFIWWFHRAYSNLAAVRNVEHSTKWAIGAWFVPILNLFRPAQIANEIATHSPAPSLNRPPLIVSWWWGTWVLGNVASRFVFRFDESTITGLIRSDTVSTLTDLLLVISAGLAIGAVRNITGAQRVRFEHLAR